MQQQNGDTPKLELDKDPTSKEEASETFSTPDERADHRNKTHQLEILKQQQGPIGRWIGCADSALTIAFVLLVLGFLCIVGAGVGMIWLPDQFGDLIGKLITFELTIAGYVMGKKSE